MLCKCRFSKHKRTIVFVVVVVRPSVVRSIYSFYVVQKASHNGINALHLWTGGKIDRQNRRQHEAHIIIESVAWVRNRETVLRFKIPLRQIKCSSCILSALLLLLFAYYLPFTVFKFTLLFSYISVAQLRCHPWCLWNSSHLSLYIFNMLYPLP